MKISEEPMRAAGVYAFTRGSVEKETRRHIRDLTGQLSRLRSEAPAVLNARQTCLCDVRSSPSY